MLAISTISIHAPSRERLLGAIVNVSVSDFNPRSLAGATDDAMAEIKSIDISIHAPSRERPDTEDMRKIIIVISIHAPSRERLGQYPLEDKLYNFNPRSLAGATRRPNAADCQQNISIHAPSRERPILPVLTLSYKHFNPRSLAGATASTKVTEWRNLFQSTLPRGSDSYYLEYVGRCNISIHAPSRERLCVTVAMRAIGRFQSTLPRGSDGYYFSHRRNFGEISIHAPSRERLTIILACTKHINISIHAPSRERHVQEFFDLYTDAISIHAPSRERHKTPLCSSLRLLFQSTLPRGSDTELLTPTPAGDISIHAPSRERPACRAAELERAPISIHAPSRERRFGFALAVKFLNLFQSTLPRGSDQAQYQLAMAALQFQSTLPRGSDLTKSTTNSTSNNFNPRSLAGATARTMMMSRHRSISIHAPSRERPNSKGRKVSLRNFNPRSLAGATSD